MSAAPVEGAPVDAEAEIALALSGESANGRAVEGEIVVTLEQELLVVIEHVQAAFKVAEQHGNGLDAFFVLEILQPLFLDYLDGERGPYAASLP